MFVQSFTFMAIVSLLSNHVALAFQSSSSNNNRMASALCMKTIAVFGASGLTASECVYQALKNGDNVVGLTR